MMLEQSQPGHRAHTLQGVPLLKEQVREVHRDLDRCLDDWLRAIGPAAPPTGSRPVALYVHAAIVEDIAIQTLLRGVPPLFATTWLGQGPARYSTDDLEPTRGYVRDVFASTDAYLTALSPHAAARTVDLSRIDLGHPTVGWVVSRFVILELARIYGELMTNCNSPAPLSNNPFKHWLHLVT
jgi:hypothetical protein